MPICVYGGYHTTAAGSSVAVLQGFYGRGAKELRQALR